MKKHLSVRYGTIQGCYWMGYAALMGYASVYLLEKGFTNTQIGLLTAVGCIVSAVLQPALASYADRPESPSVRTMLLGANLIQLVLIISLAATAESSSMVVRTLLYGASITMLMLIAQIKNRNYKFIIYMDDLSFEEFEFEYKYLKAVIEGGLEKRPNNILIYATSNRRHLIKEDYSDKAGTRQDMHTSDTVQEKLSLVYRFGVSIYFGAPDKKEFQKIVSTLAERYGVTLREEELLAEANKWELSHGGLSGRTAQQFIDYLLGKQ